MTERVDREALRANYMRRLQKLEERRALLGLSADPSVELEIEEIQRNLQDLDAPGGQPGAAPSGPVRGTTISAVFHAPVGNVHQGSGDINVQGHQPAPDPGPQLLISLLRRGVRDHAPPDLAAAAQIRIHSLEEAIRRYDTADAEDALRWLQQRVPALAGQIQELRRYLSDGSA